jgi:hypothetical protein
VLNANRLVDQCASERDVVEVVADDGQHV